MQRHISLSAVSRSRDRHVFDCLRASHTRERRRAKRSGGVESGEEAPLALVLQREPARKLRFRPRVCFLHVVFTSHGRKQKTWGDDG